MTQAVFCSYLNSYLGRPLLDIRSSKGWCEALSLDTIKFFKWNFLNFSSIFLIQRNHFSLTRDALRHLQRVLIQQLNTRGVRWRREVPQVPPWRFPERICLACVCFALLCFALLCFALLCSALLCLAFLSFPFGSLRFCFLYIPSDL